MTIAPQESEPLVINNKREALSQDQWRRSVSDEIRRRINLASRASSSRMLRSATLAAIKDPAFGLETFVSDWVWTYDPRGETKDLPFVLWDRQKKLLKWVQAVEDRKGDTVIDKSRDTGVTWLIAAYMVWRWLTVPGWAGAIGSRKADVMDKIGDPKSAFWKIEYMIRMLPDWMRPEGFDFRKHRHYGRVINPSNGSTITGEAGPEMGRGGRSSFYFLDEMGTMPRAEQVQAAVADNAASIVYASTATGPGTLFYRIVHGGNIPHFRITWRHDPRKDQAWYDDYVQRYGKMIAAREVDVDYGNSGEDCLIPGDWVRAAIELDLGPMKGIHAGGLDVGGSGDNETVFIERRGAYVVAIESWKGRDPVTSSSIVAEMCEVRGVEVLRFDNIGVGEGVSGAMASRATSFNYFGVNVGLPPTDSFYPDARERCARERFANLKAELWWSLRLRFQNSYRYQQGEPVNPDDCISIPNDHILISQLSQPLIEANERGLLRVESKDRLRRRGVSSPDRADALVLAFADSVNDAPIFFDII